MTSGEFFKIKLQRHVISEIPNIACDFDYDCEIGLSIS